MDDDFSGATTALYNVSILIDGQSRGEHIHARFLSGPRSELTRGLLPPCDEIGLVSEDDVGVPRTCSRGFPAPNTSRLLLITFDLPCLTSATS